MCGPTVKSGRPVKKAKRAVFTSAFLSSNIARVKPFELLSETVCPDGSVMKMVRRGEEYIILADGATLMSSRVHGSEEELAELACARLRSLPRACLLIGGLGMGFTLRAALDLIAADAAVVVAELVPAVVEWNRGVLGPLAGDPLKDPRVRVETGDVAGVLSASVVGSMRCCWMWTMARPRLRHRRTPDFTMRGIAAARAALKSGGVLAVWAARDDAKFAERLRRGGFDVQVQRVRDRANKRGARRTIFLGHKR